MTGETLRLPSGRCVRGRSLRQPRRLEGEEPDWGLYLLDAPPADLAWDWEWIDWPDFRLPRDRDAARQLLIEAWRRSEIQRVEIACAGGRGRTGTALACLAVLDGLPSDKAVAFVREHYHPRAVETWGQRRYVAGFGS